MANRDAGRHRRHPWLAANFVATIRECPRVSWRFPCSCTPGAMTAPWTHLPLLLPPKHHKGRDTSNLGGPYRIRNRKMNHPFGRDCQALGISTAQMRCGAAATADAATKAAASPYRSKIGLYHAIRAVK